MSLQETPAPEGSRTLEGSSSLEGGAPQGGASGASGLDPDVAEPEVMLAILARNTAHTLPNFLGYVENLDYPKHKISVW